MEQKKKFTLGYTDSYGDFNKVKEKKPNGATQIKKFDSIKDCEKFIKDNELEREYKVMIGWDVVKTIKRKK